MEELPTDRNLKHEDEELSEITCNNRTSPVVSLERPERVKLMTLVVYLTVIFGIYKWASIYSQLKL